MKEYPKPGEKFFLKLNGQDPENHPLAMAKRHGYDPAMGWQFKGRTITEPATQSFMIVLVGRCRDWAELKNKLKAEGETPEVQWLEVFRQTCPDHDGQGSIRLANATWLDGHDRAHFPSLNTRGRWRLVRANSKGGFSKGRYLVKTDY